MKTQQEKEEVRATLRALSPLKDRAKIVAKAKQILAHLKTELLREEVALERALAGEPEDIAGLGRAIAEYGAMLVDTAEGRSVNAGNATTKKVRLGLGYTRP